MKAIRYNFQVRSLGNGMDWESIEPMCRTYHNRNMALLFARRLSKDHKAEVRLTEGTNHLITSGTYIREVD